MRKLQTPLADLDGRTEVARIMRERFQSLVHDLGGAERLSHAQKSLVERSLWIELWVARQERKLANGVEVDAGEWLQAVSTLRAIHSLLLTCKSGAQI